MKCFLAAATLLALGLALGAAPASGRGPQAAPRLPEFAGWQLTQNTLLRSAPAPDQAALAEYGLQWLLRATYRRADRQIHVTAFRFGDAGGAYGAFTYFRPEGFHVFDLAQPREQAASGGNLILFTRGQWLLQVEMDKLTAMTASEMRQFAAALGPSAGNELALPTLPYYFPRQHLDPSSLRFAEGPAGLGAAAPWLPAAEVGFDRSAEVAVASYNLPLHDAGAAQLAVIAYPTPQMARTRLPELARLAGVQARRSGPLLVLAHAAGADAAALLQAVNYDADITMVPPTPVGIEGLPALILGIFVLCGAIIAIAVVVGVLTGAARVLIERVLPERFHRPPAEALIRLHLE
ncbi:MAG: DUF6599 family protein [Terriglobales bacterium]